MSEPRTKAADEKFCGDCGEVIKARAEICPKCGCRQKSDLAARHGSANKTVAGLLALFLGGLGIHKFYLGKGGQGVLYLLFCWTLIPALIAFIEALNYFLMSEETFNARYN